MSTPVLTPEPPIPPGWFPGRLGKPFSRFLLFIGTYILAIVLVFVIAVIEISPTGFPTADSSRPGSLPDSISWPIGLALSLVVFPAGLSYLPAILFPKVFQLPNPLDGLFVPWVIYFGLLAFGAGTSHRKRFVVIYSVFLILLLTNIAGCTYFGLTGK